MTDLEIEFIGLYIEALFYGLYLGIFVIYLQYEASRKDTSKTQKIIFYSISTLYVTTTIVYFCDILPNFTPKSSLIMGFIETTSFGCCDFIAQFILIYRCWIVWGSNIRVVIIPSILAVAFLGTWLAAGDSMYIYLGQVYTPKWGNLMVESAIGLSLTVNALVMGLIVFRILKVFRQVKTTADDQILGAAGGSKLRRMIFILIESGMALFSVQLVRLVVTTLWPKESANRAIFIMPGIHEMLTGITPTIIVVRTSMGLSFDEEKTMEEFAIESLRFDHPSSVPETESIGIVDRDSRDDDDN